jgi:hypothetical protein
MKRRGEGLKLSGKPKLTNSKRMGVHPSMRVKKPKGVKYAA